MDLPAVTQAPLPRRRSLFTLALALLLAAACGTSAAPSGASGDPTGAIADVDGRFAWKTRLHFAQNGESADP